MRLFLLFISLCAIIYATPLSVRTNNAGNIKYNKHNDWIGQTGSENGFAKFDTKEHGLRAMRIVVLKNIQATKTVNCFVMRYASEPSESLASQHLINYARTIKNALGKDFISEEDLDVLVPLMVKLEGGQEAYDYFYPKKEPIFVKVEEVKPENWLWYEIAGIAKLTKKEEELQWNY